MSDNSKLAGDDPEPGEPFMYKMPGDHDWHVDFAPLPEGAFRIKALAAAPLPQQAAGDEMAVLVEHIDLVLGKRWVQCERCGRKPTHAFPEVGRFCRFCYRQAI